MKKPQKSGSVIALIGLVLLLVGIYASVRTTINLIFFEKYPVNGVLTINIGAYPPYYSQREEDCQYPMSYFTPNGEPRPATDDEKSYEKKQLEICLSGVAQARESAKINDVSMAGLFLLLGIGVLVGKRYIA